MGLVISGGRALRVNSSPIETMRESIVDIRRQIEDMGWVNLSEDVRHAGLEDTQQRRNSDLKRIRVMARRNPLAKQSINLLLHYVLGQGITLKANNRRLVARIVDEFMENTVNQKVFTSHQAMQRSLRTTYRDGEHHLILFPDTDAGTVELGTIDAMEVVDVIPAPDNKDVARWWKVKRVKRAYDYSSGTWETNVGTGDEYEYFRDWSNDSDEDAPPKKLQRDGLLYPIMINQQGLRGESEMLAALDWVVAHRDFMEGRATLNKAAAQFAWRKKRQGAAADVAASVEALRSTLTQGGRGYETNPPPAPGSTLVENMASTTEWIKTDTGGGAADYDERKLRMMAGAGLGGVPNHYFGDEAQANLATATAMELPLLKTYQDWQTLYASVVHDLIGFALQTANEAGRIGERDDSSRYAERTTTPQKVIAADNALGDVAEALGSNPAAGSPFGAAGQITMIPKTEPAAIGQTQTDTSGKVDWYVDVDFPPIVEKDLGTYVTSIKAFYELLPTGNLESQKLACELVLNVLGVNDVDQVMERLFPPDMVAVAAPPMPDAQALLAKLLAQAAPQLPGQPKPLALPGPSGKPDQAQQVAEALAGLRPLAEYRARRMLRAVSDYRESLAVGD